MAIANPDTALFTSAALKVYLDISGSSNDTALAALVPRVSGMVSSWCGRRFTQTTYTNERYDGTGARNLWLNAWPITSPLTSLYHDDGYVFATALTEVVGATTSGDYIVHREGTEAGLGRIVLLAGTWGTAPMSIKVTYQGGYATIPDEVQMACFRCAAHIWYVNLKKLHAVSAESIQAGGGSLTVVEHKMPPDVQEMLIRWRRIHFA